MKKSLRIIFSLITLLFLRHSSEAQLTANFTATVTSGCAPLTVVFTNTSTGGATSFNWNFGNTNSSTNQNPGATYSVPGTYTVTLTVSNGTTTDQEVKTNYITVYSNPVASFTATPDTACVGSPISFHSTSSSGTGGAVNHWRWNFGDGNIDNVSGLNASHGYSFPQTFGVNLIVSDSHGCNSTISKNVVAVNGPVANFTTTPASGCNAPLLIACTNTTSGTVSSYQWSFGDAANGANNSSTLTNPFHTFNATGTYTITLTAHSGSCTAIHSYALQIQYTTAAFSTDSAICDGDTAFFTNNTIPSNATYTWDFGDGTTDQTTNPFHHYQSPGFYTVHLTSTANGCTNSTTRVVHVRARPNAILNAIPIVSCLNPQIVSFTILNPNIASCIWNFGDPLSGSSDTSFLLAPTHTYNYYAIYLPYAIVTDIYGCKDTTPMSPPQPTVNLLSLSATIKVIKDSVPYNIAGPDSGCVPLTLLFKADQTNYPTFPISQCIWNFDDGTGNFITTSDTIRHTFTSVRYYTVSLTITTPTGCSDTHVRKIGAGTPPNASFITSATTICFGDTIFFTGTTPPITTSYFWDYGDGTTIVGDSITAHIYNSDTAVISPFTVTMVAFNHGCPDTSIQQHLITVLPPVPNFGYQHDCTDHFTYAFFNFSRGSTNVQWYFGDTTAISTIENATHTFLFTGMDTITITAFDSITGCSYHYYRVVAITDPVARFTTTPPAGCVPLSVNFTDNSQDAVAASYFWTFGDPASVSNDTSYLLNPTHTFNATGVYHVQLNIKDVYNCLDSIIKDVHVFGATAGFTSNVTSGCAPLNLTFSDTSLTAGSSIISHQWDFGNGTTTVTTPSIAHAYPLPGTYSVTLSVVDSSGCQSTTTYSAYINTFIPEPAVVISDTFACPGQPITFDISSGSYVVAPLFYEISYGDFTNDTLTASSSTQQFTHAYASNNSYPISIHVTDAIGCDSTITSHLTILKPTANYGVSILDTCVSQPPFNTNITTTFATFSDLSTGMPGATGNSWYWNFGTAAGTQSVLQNPTAQYNTPGFYTPQLIVTNAAGCSDTARLDSIVNVPGPSGNFSLVPSNGCAPLTVNFSGSTATGGLFYTWDFGDGNILSEIPDSNVMHTYIRDGTYNPFFYIGYQLPSGSFCKAVGPNLTGHVIVKTFLTVNINPSVVYVPEEYDTTVFAVVFDTTQSGGPPFIYAWSPLTDISATDSLAIVSLNNNASASYYYCTVTNAQGCKATDSVLVLLFPCDTKSIIPSVFTPNGDNLNDTYYINYLCATRDFRFTVFNRWGEIVYESNDPYFHWDGKNKRGNDVSEGTYYYIMHASRRDSNGFIEIIRQKK